MSGVISNKRNTESKYVSVFADSRPDVDVTFRQELLSRPSDHFLVGVDNLTVSLNSLSMLLLEDGDVLRIGRIRKVAAGFVYQNNLDLATNLAARRSPTVRMYTRHSRNLYRQVERAAVPQHPTVLAATTAACCRRQFGDDARFGIWEW